MNYQISAEVGISDFFFADILTNSSSLHIHSHMEFIYVLQGNIEVYIADKNYSLTKGNMAVSMPYETHGYEFGENSRAFALACPPEYLSEYRQILTGKVFEPPVARITNIHKMLIDTIVDEKFSDDFKKKALLYCTVSDFLGSSELTESPVFEYDIYRKALIYISENFKDNVTLEKTALFIGVSAAHLSRVLNSNGKRGFSEILNSLRVYEARKLIERGDLPISEIAMESGFGSIRNFNRIFQKHFGIKPSDIKK